MPGGDRTGPMGMGPMTGRGMGYCAGYSVPGYMNWNVAGRWYFGAGRGGIPWGCGRGRVFGGARGFWWRSRAYPYPTFMGYAPGWGAPSPEQEKEMLKKQMELLEEEMSSLRKRLEELEKKPREEE